MAPFRARGGLTKSEEPIERGSDRRDPAGDGHHEREKERVPAGPVPQPPGEQPIENGGVDKPAAFPPHN